MDLRPIRKLAVGALASLLALGASALGLHVGPDIVNEAAVSLIGLAAAWAVKDPRVKAVETKLDHSELLNELTNDPRVREAAQDLYESTIAERIKQAVADEMGRLGFPDLTPAAQDDPALAPEHLGALAEAAK